MEQILVKDTQRNVYSINMLHKKLTKELPKQMQITQKLFTMLKNNKILGLYIYEYVDNNFYKQLFELLKINISVTSLCISYQSNTNNNKFYELLSDYLSISTYLKYINFGDYNISVENSILLSSALKKNNSLIQIHLYYQNLDKKGCNYIIDSLKFNKTVTYFIINVPSIDGNYLAELLKVNTTLTAIQLHITSVGEYRVEIEIEIEKALKNNRYITVLILGYRRVGMEENIKTYCERNKYNNNLKSLMLQDL
jgi:hypothetical protein